MKTVFVGAALASVAAVLTGCGGGGDNSKCTDEIKKNITDGMEKLTPMTGEDACKLAKELLTNLDLCGGDIKVGDTTVDDRKKIVKEAEVQDCGSKPSTCTEENKTKAKTDYESFTADKAKPSVVCLKVDGWLNDMAPCEGDETVKPQKQEITEFKTSKCSSTCYEDVKAKITSDMKDFTAKKDTDTTAACALVTTLLAEMEPCKSDTEIAPQKTEVEKYNTEKCTSKCTEEAKAQIKTDMEKFTADKDKEDAATLLCGEKIDGFLKDMELCKGNEAIDVQKSQITTFKTEKCTTSTCTVEVKKEIDNDMEAFNKVKVDEDKTAACGLVDNLMKKLELCASDTDVAEHIVEVDKFKKANCKPDEAFVAHI